MDFLTVTSASHLLLLMFSCDATAFTLRSKAWMDTHLSLARWSETYSVLPRFSTGSERTSSSSSESLLCFACCLPSVPPAPVLFSWGHFFWIAVPSFERDAIAKPVEREARGYERGGARHLQLNFPA